jgi:type I restriction-modification system DNA methylase subunit
MRKMGIVASGSTVIDAIAILNDGEEKKVKAEDLVVIDNRNGNKIMAVYRTAVGSNENLRAVGFSPGIAYARLGRHPSRKANPKNGSRLEDRHNPNRAEESVTPLAKTKTKVTAKRVTKKQEAVTVTRFIHEVLVGQLGIPIRQIVNDTTFANYTGSKRPDLLVSEFEYDPVTRNESEFIENLVAYAEAKDDCKTDDSDWKEALTQGWLKAPKLKLPYFIVTNCRTTIFYNSRTKREIGLNGNPIREFQTIDILRLIKNKLRKDPSLHDIVTDVGSLAAISEAIFNKKLWELTKIYRNINFENTAQKIDFTIGFIALEIFEERESKKDANKIYWSNCSDGSLDYSAEKIVGNLSKYISRLEQQSQFGEFANLMELVRVAIVGKEKQKPIVDDESVKQIYTVIDSMNPLRESGFDLFGAVYEMFADTKEKKTFGQYFTRRHYAYIFSKLLLLSEQHFDRDRKFKVLDPACGTGGFLTEGFKVLRKAYAKTKTLTPEAERFLAKDCFWGTDVQGENISRTKLNMFLVGDGHAHMEPGNTLGEKFIWEGEWDYIITNPPVGAGVVKAETTVVSSSRTEVAFLYKVIRLLKDGGKACILLPDGVLENPNFTRLRKDLLEKCTFEAIVSLPKFAFAPYTKEKMYAVYFTKRNPALTKIQKEPIWMYIIDNDGLANSDKRFPTKLRNSRNGWLHDEITGWVSTDGEEMPGALEERWHKFDDATTDGTEWLNERGETVRLRKGGFVEMAKITDPKSYYCLKPEYYLRPYEPSFITLEQLSGAIQSIEREISMALIPK